jgi:lipopolysaccharide heptosyltransferase I
LKILILKPSSLGDVIQALPVLRLLKLHYPRSEVYWWVDSRFAPLLENDPDLAGLYRFDRRRWGSPLNWGGLVQSIREMRARAFDLVIDLQALARSAAFAWLANGEFTLGLDDPREGAPGFYDAAVPRPSPRTHAVEWYLETLRYLRVPVHDRFDWISARADVKRSIEEKWPDNGSRWIALAPGARWPNKRWPVASFGTLATLLAAARPDLRFAVVGGPEDAEIGREMEARLPEICVNLAGKTSLPELVEWVRRADAVVSNDTGPMHVAAALGKPVWALFGPTDPARTGPYGQVQRVLRLDLPCSPCMKPVCAHSAPLECLRALSPESVARTILTSGL